MKKITVKIIIRIIIIFSLLGNINLLGQTCGSISRTNPSPNLSSIISESSLDKLKLKDRFGNEYLFDDLKIKGKSSIPMPGAANTIQYSCNAGLFNLEFVQESSTTYGFSNVIYRDVVCQVFSDISRLLYDINPSNPNRVNLLIASESSINTTIGGVSMPAGTNGIGSGFELLDNKLNNAFIDNAVYTTIKNGKNSYENIFNNYPINSYNYYHGMLLVDFSSTSYYTNMTAVSIGSNQVDLYSLVLHEALHILGLSSYFNQFGSSLIGNNLYSRYDNNIYKSTTSQKVLNQNSSSFTISKTISNLSLGCSAPNNIIFSGANLSNQLVFTNSIWQNGINLSHFGCSGSGFCNSSSYALPLSNNVLTPCYGTGINFLKRHPSQNEVYALCDIGYKLKSITGVYAYGDQSWNDTTYGNIYKTYNSCTEPCIAVGGHDTFYRPYASSFTINYNTSILNNDIPTTSVVGRIYLLDSSQGSITTTSSGFTFIPNPNHYSTEINLVYFPKCNTTGALGSATFITVFCNYNSVLPCYNNNECNYICNGTFEETNDPNAWSNFVVYDPQGINTVDLYRSKGSFKCRRDHIQNFWHGCDADSGCYFQTKSTTPSYNGGNQFIGMGANQVYSEGVHFKLRKPVFYDTSKSYHLKFQAKVPLGGCKPVKIYIVANDSVPLARPKALFYQKFGFWTCNSGFCSIIGSEIIAATVNFNDYDIKLSQPTSGDSFTDIIVYLALDTVTPGEGSQYYAYFDNFELYDSAAPKPIISSNPSTYTPCTDTSHTILYTVCMSNTSVLNADSIIVQLNLPTGIKIDTGSSFDSTGKCIIPSSTISFASCSTLVLKYSFLSTIDYTNSFDIGIGYTSSGYCGEYQSNLVKVYPQNKSLTLIKTASNTNPVLGDTVNINLQVCNSSIYQSLLDLRDSLPQGMELIEANGFTINGKKLNMNINIPAALNSTTPSCISVNYKVLITSNCFQSSCASISSFYNSCFKASSCLTLNSSSSGAVVQATFNPTKPVWCGSPIPMAVNIINPSGTYTYQWQKNGSNITGATNTGYTITQNGLYSVLINHNGCISMHTVPKFDTVLRDSVIVMQTACGFQNGSIEVYPLNGIKPYTYTWSGSSVTSNNRISLGMGIYKLTITDSIGCKRLDTILLAGINTIKIAPNIIYPSCDNPTGSIVLNPSSGKPPYKYNWSKGDTTMSISNLKKGVYKVTITDSVGCQRIDSFKLNPFGLKYDLTPRSTPSCSWGNIILTTSVYPKDSIYSIDWYKDNNLIYSGLDSILTSFGSGIYKTILNYQGCLLTDSVNLTIKSKLKSNLTISNLDCKNSTGMGNITANPTGGSSPYTYLWSTGATTSSIGGLNLGSFSLTITDALGCSVTENPSIVIGNRINAFISSKLNCISNTVSLTAIAGDGVEPYTYLWSTGATTKSISVPNTNATYTATITDASGCIIEATENTNLAAFENIGSGVGKRTIYDAVTDEDACAPFPCPNWSIKYINGSRINTGKNYRVYDTLYLQEGGEFNYCDFILEPNAVIQVGAYMERNPSPPNATIFKGCTIYTCGNQLANGIECLDGRGEWTSDNHNFVSIENSVVEDCKSVVKSPYYSSINLVNSYFNNNQYVVEIQDDIYTIDKVAGVSAIGNIFDGSPSIKNGLSSLAAINFKGRGGLMIGSTSMAKNVFKNMPNGILTTGEYLQVENSQFLNLETAIKHTPAVNSANSYCSILGLGINAADPNTFSNCGIAIHSTNTNFIDTNSKMDNVGRGILYTNTISPYTVNISGNKINSSGTAINTSLTPNTELKITNNEVNIISTDSSTNGIEVSSTGAAGTSTGSWVKNNIITMNGSANFGILNTNCNNLRFYCNTVNIPMPNTTCNVLGGIKYSGVSTGIIESNNTVTSDNISNRLKITNRQTTTDPTNPYPFPVGIYYDNSSVKSNCNFVNNIRTGVRYTGSCPSADMKRTQFNNHDIGLRFDNTVVLGIQSNKGNTFDGTCNQEARSFSTGLLPTYWIKGTNVGTNYDPSPVLPTNVNPTKWWITNISNDTSCAVYGGGSGCTASPLPFSRPMPGYSELQAKILSNTLEFDVYEDELIYHTKQELYFMLKPEEANFQDSTAEKQFLALMDSTTVLQAYYELHEQELAMYPDYAFQSACISLQNSIAQGQTELMRLDSMRWEHVDHPVLYPQICIQYNTQFNSVQSNIQALDNLLSNQQQNNVETVENLNEQNQSIVPLNLVDSIQSIFNELYYNTILVGNYNLSLTEKQAYVEFANTCPLLNPQAVYTARGVVSIWNKSTYYNDAELCSQAGYAYKRVLTPFIKPEAALSCTLAPNPTKYSSQLLFSEIPKEKVQIIVTDIQGRLMVLENKLMDRNIYEIDTKRYANGIYFVKVMMGKEHILSSKLEVLK